jgi:hypothetical protein
MFCERPLRASRNGESPPADIAPPHKTRRSDIGVSTLPQFGAKLFERHVRKPARSILGDRLLLLKSLSVPLA